MKNQLALLIGIVVAVVLIAQMISFQVRYDEVAVRAMFEKAGESDLIDGSKTDVEGNGPGLYPKWPWPIQSVYTYSQKLQVLDGEQTEGLTADGKAIIVRLYCTWRVDDALAFYRTQRNMAAAERTLRPMLANMSNIVPQYSFRQFVNTDGSQLRLAEFEQACTEKLRSEVQSQGYGIYVEHVGVRQALLSESITPQVFEAMKKKQQSLAEEARAAGIAEANSIRDSANSVREQILAFAERRAAAIRAEGNQEAAAYFSQFNQDPQFAIYLIHLDALKKTLSNNTTFILDANQNSFLQPLITEGAQ